MWALGAVGGALRTAVTEGVRVLEKLDDQMENTVGQDEDEYDNSDEEKDRSDRDSGDEAQQVDETDDVETQGPDEDVNGGDGDVIARKDAVISSLKQELSQLQKSHSKALHKNEREAGKLRKQLEQQRRDAREAEEEREIEQRQLLDLVKVTQGEAFAKDEEINELKRQLAEAEEDILIAEKVTQDTATRAAEDLLAMQVQLEQSASSSSQADTKPLERLRSQCDELTNQVQQLNEQLKDSDEALDAMRQEGLSMHTMMTSAQENAQKFEISAAEQSALVKDLCIQLSNAKHELETLTHALKEEQNAKNIAAGQLSSLGNDGSAPPGDHAEVSELKDRLADMQTELESVKIELETATEMYKNEIEDLASKLTVVNDALEHAQSDLVQAHTESDKLKSENKNLERFENESLMYKNEIEELANKLTSASDELMHAHSELNMQKSENVELETALLTYKNQIEDLVSKLTSANIELRHAHAESDRLESEKVELETALLTYKNEIQDLASKLTDANNALEHAKSESYMQKEELRTATATYTHEIEQLNTELEGQKSENLMHTGELDLLRTQVLAASGSHDTQVEDLVNRVHELQRHCDGLQKEKVAAEERVSNMENELEAEKGDNAALVSEVETARERMSDSGTRLRDLQALFDEKNAQVVTLQAHIQELQHALALEKSSSEALTSENDLKNKLCNAEIERANLKRQLADFTTEHEKHIARYAHEQRASAEALRSLRGDLESARADLERERSLRNELENSVDQSEQSSPQDDVPIDRSALEEELTIAQERVDELHTYINTALELERASNADLSAEITSLKHELQTVRREAEDLLFQEGAKYQDIHTQLMHEREQKEAAKSEVHRIQTDLQTASSQILKLQTELTSYTDTYESLRILHTQIDEKSACISKLESELKHELGMRVDVGKKLADTENVVHKHAENINILGAQLAYAREYSADLEEKNRILQEKVQNLTENIGSLHVDLEKASENSRNFQEKDAFLHDKISNLTLELEKSVENSMNLGEENTFLQEKITSLEEKISNLEKGSENSTDLGEENTFLLEKIQNLTLELEKGREYSAEIEGKNSFLEEKVQDLTLEIDTYSHKISSLRVELEKASENSRNFQENNRILQEKIQTFEQIPHEAASAQALVERLQADLKNSRQELSLREISVREISLQYEKLEKKFRQEAESNSELAHTCKNLHAEIHALKSEYENVVKKYDQERETNARLALETTQLKDMVRGERESNAAAENRASEMEARFCDLEKEFLALKTQCDVYRAENESFEGMVEQLQTALAAEQANSALRASQVTTMRSALTNAERERDELATQAAQAAEEAGQAIADRTKLADKKKRDLNELRRLSERLSEQQRASLQASAEVERLTLDNEALQKEAFHAKEAEHTARAQFAALKMEMDGLQRDGDQGGEGMESTESIIELRERVDVLQENERKYVHEVASKEDALRTAEEKCNELSQHLEESKLSLTLAHQEVESLHDKLMLQAQETLSITQKLENSEKYLRQLETSEKDLKKQLQALTAEARANDAARRELEHGLQNAKLQISGLQQSTTDMNVLDNSPVKLSQRRPLAQPTNMEGGVGIDVELGGVPLGDSENRWHDDSHPLLRAAAEFTARAPWLVNLLQRQNPKLVIGGILTEIGIIHVLVFYYGILRSC